MKKRVIISFAGLNGIGTAEFMSAARPHRSERNSKDVAADSGAAAIDSTESKAPNAPTDRSQELRRLLHARQTLVGVIEWNLNFEVTEWNPAAERIFGWSRAEMLGRHAREIVPEPASAHVDSVWNGLLQQTGGTRSINENVTRDGRHILCEWHNTPLIDADGRVMGVASIVQDITERARAEEALRRERNLFLSGPVVVFRWRAAENWPVDYASPNVAALFGWTADDFMEERVTYAQVIHPEDTPRIIQEVQAFASQGARRFEQTYRIVRPDGDVRWLYDLTVVVRDAKGRITHFEGYVLDETDRRAEQEERRKLENQMLHAQKLESLGVLAGGVAHDFANLLVGILGYAELALGELPPETRAREWISRILGSAQRAADLTGAILAYAGKGRIELEVVDLNALVLEIARLLEVSISRLARLRFELAAEPPQIRADATQLRQVLMNLMLNASESIPSGGGEILARTGEVDLDSRTLAACEPAGGPPPAPGRYAYVEICDTGCGMSSEVRARLFDPFFTTKATGRGLGMAAVLGITRGHGGAISVSTVVGRGTSFKVFLPLPGTPVIAPSAEKDAPRFLPAGEIVVVDDDPAVRATIHEMLHQLGCRVVLFDGGAAALEYLSDYHSRVSAMVLDLTMAAPDGEATFREIHRRWPLVPVMIASGFGEAEFEERFRGTRPAGFLRKPFMLKQLRDTLARIARH